MKRYAKINEIGEPIYTCDIDYHLKPDDMILIPENISSQDLLDKYIWLNSDWYERGKRPQDHLWKHESLSFVLNIDMLRGRKKDEINKECVKSITGGFKSDALGAFYTYPSKERDQTNLNMALQMAQTNVNATLIMCADVNGAWAFREHAAWQVNQVWLDLFKSIEAARVKNLNLQNLITTAQTAEEINAINWN